jgi:thiosulfate dehydrogenase
MLAVAFVLTGMSLAPSAVSAEEIQSKIALGGKLYDKWYQITSGKLPKRTHKAYGEKGKKSGKTTWRCKECHGWDYNGKDGAYGKGSRFSGIKGIRAAAGMAPDKVISVLKDDTHKFSDEYFTPDEFEALALFVGKGQFDMNKYIDLATRKVKGDAGRGVALYGTICANCHGKDGKKIDDMPPLGKVAQDNPWETLHKILNGQPDEKMPALRALPIEISVDILAYASTLPR